MEAGVLDPGVEPVQSEESTFILVPQLNRLLTPEVPVRGDRTEVGAADVGDLEKVIRGFGRDLDDGFDVEPRVVFLVDFLERKKTDV